MGRICGRTLECRRLAVRWQLSECWPAINFAAAGGGFRGSVGRRIFKTTNLCQSVMQPDLVTNKVIQDCANAQKSTALSNEWYHTESRQYGGSHLSSCFSLKATIVVTPCICSFEPFLKRCGGMKDVPVLTDSRSLYCRWNSCCLVYGKDLLGSEAALKLREAPKILWRQASCFHFLISFKSHWVLRRRPYLLASNRFCQENTVLPFLKFLLAILHTIRQGSFCTSALLHSSKPSMCFLWPRIASKAAQNSRYFSNVRVVGELWIPKTKFWE